MPSRYYSKVESLRTIAIVPVFLVALPSPPTVDIIIIVVAPAHALSVFGILFLSPPISTKARALSISSPGVESQTTEIVVVTMPSTALSRAAQAVVVHLYRRVRVTAPAV